jgi:uroporphyrinogen-III synthase
MPRVQKIVSELKLCGVNAVAIGLQKIVVSHELRAQTDLVRKKIASFDLVIFVSPNAVDVFFETPLSGELPQNLRWICVGQATGQALCQHLAPPIHRSILIGNSNDADAVLVLLSNLRDEMRTKNNAQSIRLPAVSPLKILVVRGATGREDWIATCQEAGDQVQVLCAYASIEQSPTQTLTQQLLVCQQAQIAGAASPVVFVVASTQLAGQLVQWLSTISPSFLAWALQQTTLAIHPKIVERLLSFGFVAPKLISPGVQGIVQGLE